MLYGAVRTETVRKNRFRVFHQVVINRYPSVINPDLFTERADGKEALEITYPADKYDGEENRDRGYCHDHTCLENAFGIVYRGFWGAEKIVR